MLRTSAPLIGALGVTSCFHANRSILVTNLGASYCSSRCDGSLLFSRPPRLRKSDTFLRRCFTSACLCDCRIYSRRNERYPNRNASAHNALVYGHRLLSHSIGTLDQNSTRGHARPHAYNRCFSHVRYCRPVGIRLPICRKTSEHNSRKIRANNHFGYGHVLERGLRGPLDVTPNQPMERTPPCCALRRRSSAR